MRTRLEGLDVDGLSLARGGLVLFRELTFTLTSGELLSLEGPNGVGKTSLLRALAGFLEPLAGSIRFKTQGSGFLSSGEERAGQVGWLGHQDGVKAQLTPYEVLVFFGSLFGETSKIDDALDGVSLARVRDLPVQYLSAGQRRRLALARLKIVSRPLWLLDEPLAALDHAGKALVAELISTHCKAGGIVIAATHEALGIDGKRLALGANRS